MSGSITVVRPDSTESRAVEMTTTGLDVFGDDRSVVAVRVNGETRDLARALSDGVCNAYVVDLWTHSAWRRQGIGRRMLDALCARLPGQHVCLFTDDAPAFYAACGFAARGTAFERIAGTWLNRG